MKWSKKKRQQVFCATNGACGYCGVQLCMGTFTIDHITPRTSGGSNDLSNLMCCCRSCNSSKNVKGLEDYRLYMELGKTPYAGIITVWQLKALMDLGHSFTLPNHQFYFEVML